MLYIKHNPSQKEYADAAKCYLNNYDSERVKKIYPGIMPDLFSAPKTLFILPFVIGATFVIAGQGWPLEIAIGLMVAHFAGMYIFIAQSFIFEELGSIINELERKEVGKIDSFTLSSKMTFKNGLKEIEHKHGKIKASAILSDYLKMIYEKSQNH